MGPKNPELRKMEKELPCAQIFPDNSGTMEPI
jgi:hypothetical protein